MSGSSGKSYRALVTRMFANSRIVPVFVGFGIAVAIARESLHQPTFQGTVEFATQLNDRSESSLPNYVRLRSQMLEPSVLAALLPGSPVDITGLPEAPIKAIKDSIDIQMINASSGDNFEIRRFMTEIPARNNREALEQLNNYIARLKHSLGIAESVAFAKPRIVPGRTAPVSIAGTLPNPFSDVGQLSNVSFDEPAKLSGEPNPTQQLRIKELQAERQILEAGKSTSRFSAELQARLPDLSETFGEISATEIELKESAKILQPTHTHMKTLNRKLERLRGNVVQGVVARLDAINQELAALGKVSHPEDTAPTTTAASSNSAAPAKPSASPKAEPAPVRKADPTPDPKPIEPKPKPVEPIRKAVEPKPNGTAPVTAANPPKATPSDVAKPAPTATPKNDVSKPLTGTDVVLTPIKQPSEANPPPPRTVTVPTKLTVETVPPTPNISEPAKPAAKPHVGLVVAGPHINPTPLRPQYLWAGLLGSVGGFALGAFLMMLRSAMDQRLHSPQEIEELGLDLEVLASLSDLKQAPIEMTDKGQP